MKKLLRSAMKRRSLLDIAPEDASMLGAKIIAIDADNTAGKDGTSEPLPGVSAWVENMKAAGYPVVLLSNAKTERASVLANKLNIPVIGFALKPLPVGFWRACLRFHVLPKHVLMVGDQVWTDVLGANLAGCTNVYVFPYEMEKRAVKSYQLKRKAEEILFTVQEYIDYQKALKNEPKKS